MSNALTGNFSFQEEPGRSPATILQSGNYYASSVDKVMQIEMQPRLSNYEFSFVASSAAREREQDSSMLEEDILMTPINAV